MKTKTRAELEKENEQLRTDLDETRTRLRWLLSNDPHAAFKTALHQERLQLIELRESIQKMLFDALARLAP